MSRMMLAGIAALICGALLAPPAAHALRDDVQAAVDAVERLRADDAKIAEYCAILEEIDAAGDDDVKLETAFNKLDTFYENLGDEYSAMFAVEDELDPGSQDAQALDDAFSALDAECQS